VSVISDLTTTIETNCTAIKEYAARLAEDSLNPQTSYSIDGESVSRNEWRTSIADIIKSLTEANMSLQELIIQQQPYIIRTRHRP